MTPELIDQDRAASPCSGCRAVRLAAGDDVYALMAAAGPSHIPGCFTLYVAPLGLAITALDCVPARRRAAPVRGLRELRTRGHLVWTGTAETA
jgi:hypothetical protein